MNDIIVHPEVAKELEAEFPAYKQQTYRQELRTRPIRFYDSSQGSIRYPRVPMCNHKFIHQTEPRHRHCESCWFTFFQVHGELTQAVEEAFQKAGPELVVKLKSRRFLNNFLKFMSTVYQLKAAQEQKALQDKSGTTTHQEVFLPTKPLGWK